MFRSIGSRLDKKQRNIEDQKGQELVAQEVVADCIEEFLGPSSVKLSWAIHYDQQQSQLTIDAKSKTLASEILLRAGEITALLRQKGVKLKQLIVR